jgi:hypothetical protein
MTVSREAAVREASKRQRVNSEICQTPQGRQAILPLVFERRSAGGRAGFGGSVSEIVSGITALLSAAMNDLQIENQTSLIVNTSNRQVND